MLCLKIRPTVMSQGVFRGILFVESPPANNKMLGLKHDSIMDQ